MPEPYYQDEFVKIYNCDWREVLPIEADLVLTDPPYGVSIMGSGSAIGQVGGHYDGPRPFGGKKNPKPHAAHAAARGLYHPVANDHSPGEAKESAEALAKTPKQIWWGGNHYGEVLGDSSCWLIWDKENTGDFADAELAWTNLTGAVRMFRHRWNGMLRASEKGQRWHPTQKPVALMDWCIQRAKLEPNSMIFDPFMGAGPVAVAAKAQGHRYVGCELVEEYCEIAAERCQQGYLGL
jgi:DNA modification methylase